MAWFKRILMIIGAFALLSYFLPTQREQMVASVKHLFKQDTPTFVPSKITVYESHGKRGEAVFSDSHSAASGAKARVVDTSKSTTFHTTMPSNDDDTSGSNTKTALLNFDQDNARFQKQAAAVRDAQMERAIYGH